MAATTSASVERVFAEFDPLITAQIQAAKGAFHLFVKGTDGRAKRVEDADLIEMLLNTAAKVNGRDCWFVATKDPDVRAWTDLANRVIGKPQESLMTIHWADALDTCPGCGCDLTSHRRLGMPGTKA